MNIQKKYLEIIFAGVATTLVLWQLLLPGYVLLLDYVAGPLANFSYHDLSSFVAVPSSGLIYLLALVLPVWVVQKLVLFGVVFALFYLPLRFFPWVAERSVPHFVSLLAVCNPFVYERLLAGQWRVVLGYACLYPLFYYLLLLVKGVTWPKVRNIFVTILLTGFVSIHFLAVELVVLFIFTLLLSLHFYRTGALGELKQLILRLGLGGLGFLLASLYWIIPYLRKGESVLNEFSGEHFLGFATARDEIFGVVGNVLAMKGFWPEGHYWAEQFNLPQSSDWMFIMALVGLLVLVVRGLLSLAKDNSPRWQARSLVIVGALAVVFASGVSAVLIWPINMWLLENVSLWNGFRDTQKWVGVLVVVYSLLAGAGLQAWLQSAKSQSQRVVVFVAAGLVPLLMVPYLWFGFAGQVQPVWYPDSWQQVATALEPEPKCRALFLPWQQYYRLNWNDSQLVANAGTQIFPCAMVTGQNTNLGKIAPIASHVADYALIEKGITRNATTTEKQAAVIAVLREAGVTHIIASDSMTGSDVYTYPFLKSPELSLLVDEVEIKLYRID